MLAQERRSKRSPQPKRPFEHTPVTNDDIRLHPKTRVFLRNAEFCIDGIPTEDYEVQQSLWCQGCCKYMSMSPNVRKNKARGDYKTPAMKCPHIFKRDTADLKLVSHQKWLRRIEEYHQTSCVVEISDDTFSSMFDLDLTSIAAPTAVETVDASINEETDTNEEEHSDGVILEELEFHSILQGGTKATGEKYCNITIEKNELKSFKRKFIVYIPRSHTVVPKSKLSMLESKASMVDLLKARVQGFEYVGSRWCEEWMKCIQSVLGFVPALALTSMAFVLPVLFYSFVVGTGFETLLDIEQLSTAFPSKDTLRNWILEYAIDCLLEIGDGIKGKSVFLACDKGHKKKVGHFVKIIS
jgi:hypothetical protein